MVPNDNEKPQPPVATPQPSAQHRVQTELSNELSTLNRVSHRLAMTEAGEPLEKVLSVLLPRLLARVGKNDDAKKERLLKAKKRKSPSLSPDNSNATATGGGGDGDAGDECEDGALHDQIIGTHNAIHAKLVEMIGHAMKRVRDDRECKLPCLAVLELLLPPSSGEGDGAKMNHLGRKITANPFTINLGLAFLTLGVQRCTPAQCSELLPGLLNFWACSFDALDDRSTAAARSTVGVGHLVDASRRMRFDQTYHLIFRAFQCVACNPIEGAATARASSSRNDKAESGGVTNLQSTKELLAADPLLTGALFDLFTDVFVYAPVSANSTLIPDGMSVESYARLADGAASQGVGGKKWKEEFATRVALRELKMQLLELIAPCRRHALFLPDIDAGDQPPVDCRGDGAMGISRTVALMVLLTGDPDVNVKSKAESYLKAHMDTYRGKDISLQPPSAVVADTGDVETSVDDAAGAITTIHDALLGNSVALAQAILSWSIGGATTTNIAKSLISKYNTPTASRILQLGLGLTYSIDSSDANQQKAFLSTSRKKINRQSSMITLKFVSKMLDDNPKLFFAHHGSMVDMEHPESDVAAVLLGTSALSVFGDMYKPGSLASPVMESCVRVLNSIVVRLASFYDAKYALSKQGVDVKESVARLRTLLSRFLASVSAVLGPTSSGESTSSATSTSSNNVALNIRDQCYGVVCTLSRSQYALDRQCALFDNGKASTNSDTADTFSLNSIATGTLLFGCASNEAEVLRPRASSALDALLGAYIRVVSFITKEREEKEALRRVEQRCIVASSAMNPWANATPSELVPSTTAVEATDEVVMGLSYSLLPLLWSASRTSQSKSSRLASARWSSELLLRLDASQAYHLLCFLSGDGDSTVSMIAKKALGVEKMLGEDYSSSDVESDSDLMFSLTEGDQGEATNKPASFSILVETVLGFKSPSSSNRRPKFADFHVRAKAATIRFLLHSLFSEESFYGVDDSIMGVALKEFVGTILTTFSRLQGRSLTREETDLIDESAIALATCTSSLKAARLEVVQVEAEFGHNDIAAQTLSSNSSKARRHLAQVVSHLYEDHSLWITTEETISIWITRNGLANVAKQCKEKLRSMLETSFVVGEVHGAAHLGASCVRAFRLAMAATTEESTEIVSECWGYCCGIVTLLGEGLAHSDVFIGNACSQGLVICFSYNDSDAPSLHTKLFDQVASAFDLMAKALKKFSSIDHADAARASSLVEAAGLLLAASTSGAGFTKTTSNNYASIDLGPARLECTEALFSILGSAVYKKDDILAITVGEALVKYADASGSGEWSGSGSFGDSEWQEKSYDEEYAFNLPPHRHILYTLFAREIKSSNPVKKTSCAATLLALIGHASHVANLDPSYIERNFVKEMAAHIDLFQASFINLLAHPKSKQLSRESCCRGLAACRGLASAVEARATAIGGAVSEIDSLNEKMLAAFGQTTNYGQSAMMESTAQAQARRSEGGGDGSEAGQEDTTEVGGAAGQSEATLGAYREMASAAISVGQIDVLYALLILSTNHLVWQTPEIRDRYSARALLGNTVGSVEEIRSTLRPQLARLIPKLLRACNDPSKQTRENMNTLWLALTGGGAESRALVTQNLLPTVDELIKDAGSKLWRARAGACGALADILVGRSWGDLGGGGVETDDEGSMAELTASIRLLRLWRMTMRALDDVRTPVRERGETLGRGVRALTIRLCDPTITDTQDDDVYLSTDQRKQKEKERQVEAEYAATVSLGWLVKYGLNQSCAEAAGICVSCILGIVDVSKPRTLQPVLAELIGSLLMAMSGLEPAALNYLQVRAAGSDSQSTSDDRYDQLERMRINLAQSGPIAGALHKCIEMVKNIDLDAQKRLIPELDAALRKGAGFATRAATADAVGSLCGTCPAVFSFPGSSMANPTVRLLRALYFASERERGATAKDKMTHNLGSLAELAPGPAVRILALKACERYSEASGNNNDPSVRKAAAATIRAIVVRASHHLADGGPKDVWCKKVLPTAFIGRHDKEPKIASMWKDIWDEGGQAFSSMDRSEEVFGVILQEKLLPSIVKATVSTLRSTSWANRRAGCAVLVELTDANILAPIARSTNDDNTNISINELARLRQRAKASGVLLSECVHIISRNRIWDGKADVVKAGTAIAAKWSASAPINAKAHGISEGCGWPIALLEDSKDDLFQGDSFFKLQRSVEEGVSGENDESASGEIGGDDIDVNGETISGDENATLDLSEEKNIGDDEQLDCGGENTSGENSESETELQERLQPPVVFGGLCRVLLEQALRTRSSNDSTEGVLPYRVSALSAVSSLVTSIASGSNFQERDADIIDKHQRFIYDLVAPSLFSFTSSQPNTGKTEPPVLIARAIECIGNAMYNGIGGGAVADGVEYADALILIKFFALSSGPKQPAWTVRQASTLAASSLIAKIPPQTLRKTEVISSVIAISTQTLKDKKFWRVRLSGLELLLSLVRRVGDKKVSRDPEKQLIMEAILPYKERIVDLARRSLADSESQVTAAASKISLAMAWWP